MTSNIDRYTVMLVSTVAPDRPYGSMRRYGQLVQQALENSRYEPCSVCVAPRQKWLHRFPKKLQTPIRYLSIASAMTRALRRATPDRTLVHLLDASHSYGVPRHSACPTLGTVHDVIPQLVDGDILPGHRLSKIGRMVVRRAAAGMQRLDRLISVSLNTSRDLQRLGHAAPRLGISHNALPPEFLGDATAEGRTPWQKRRDALAPFILHVGNNTFYKNDLRPHGR